MIRHGIRRLFRLRPLRPERLAEEVDEEIRMHLALREEQLVRSGLSREDARAEARRRFGSADHTRHQLYRSARRRENRMRLRDRLDTLRQDLRYAARGVVRERGTSFAIVLTLAVGIGANAATFGVFDRLLLSGPEHVRDADRVVRYYTTTTSRAACVG